jgi:uncharacterized protein (DUF433 family)
MNKRIVSDPEILSGTPVFLGTRIAIDHVAGLIQKGATDAELAEDFPGLNKEDFEYARTYALTYQPPRTPPKPLQLRRRTRAA